MFNLVAIGDPIIDTHVQLSDDAAECRETAEHRTHLCFDYGAKIPIIDSFQCLGGNAPNVAAGAAKLGLKSGLVATVGDDSNGHMSVEALKKSNVNTDCVTFDTKNKTRYSIVLNYKAERTILSYSEKKNYVWPKHFPQTEWIYYTGLSAGFESVQKKLIQHLKQHPTVRLAINPGSYMLKYNLDDLRDMIPRTDLLIVNKEEAEQILGRTEKQQKNMATIIHKLLAKGAHEVAITDGVRGAWAGNESGSWHMDPYPVKVIAKTGAGDAFSSAYISARHFGQNIAHALLWGTANASSVVMAHGPQAGMMNLKGVKKMIKKFPKIEPFISA
ncbi:MAG: carbohydrate kinase family protein [Candidatus Magasanikbacteria bacterium]|nr:carbohydrate kinase family protein [Candidatus Magasanikbacteria bacterium]